MLTLNEIRNVNFRKSNFGGYRAEDVEAFIDEVQLSYDSLLKENAELLKRLESLTAKLEEYQQEEDSIRNALMNAQKVGDASLRDAKHKAEIILKDATIKAEKIVSNAQIEIHRERDVIEKMQRDIADFKAKLLKTYKEHLTLINSIPNEDIMSQDTKDAVSSVPMLDRDSPYGSSRRDYRDDYGYSGGRDRDLYGSQDSYGARDGYNPQDSYSSRDSYNSQDSYSSRDSYNSQDGYSSRDSYGSQDGYNSSQSGFTPQGTEVGYDQPQQDYGRGDSGMFGNNDNNTTSSRDYAASSTDAPGYEKDEQPVLPRERINQSRGGFTVDIDDNLPSSMHTTTLPPPARSEQKFSAFDNNSRQSYDDSRAGINNFDRTPISSDDFGSYPGNSSDPSSLIGSSRGNSDFSKPAYDSGNGANYDNDQKGFRKRF